MFCINCGKEVDGSFCSGCGSRTGNTTQAPVSSTLATTNSTEETTLWEGQPSGLMDKAKSAANVNSTHYKITNQRVIVTSGLIGKKQEEVELHKVKDYKINQTMSERLQKIGSVVIVSVDSTAPILTLSNVSDPDAVKEILRKAVMEYRQKMNITYRENM